MRIVIIFLCFLVMSGLVYADEFFMNSDIKDIRVISINTNAGRAVLADTSGNEAQVSIGDMVGVEGATVSSMNQSYITIQIGNTKSRIPVKRAVGKSAGS